MENICSSTSDVHVSHLEKNIRDKICELHRNTRALETLQKEHIQVREELGLQECQLQNERRISCELKSRLNSANQVINRLEEEEMRKRLEHVRLAAEYESASKQRDCFVIEASNARAEATKLKFKLESSEEILHRETEKAKKLEKSLVDLRNDCEKVIETFNANVDKITKEQKHVLDSCKTIIGLNKRLQNLSICLYNINQQKEAKLKELECKLIAAVSEKSNFPENVK